MSVYELIDEFLTEAFTEQPEVDNRAVDMVRGVAGQIDQITGPISDNDSAALASVLLALGGTISGVLNRQE